MQTLETLNIPMQLGDYMHIAVHYYIYWYTRNISMHLKVTEIPSLFAEYFVKLRTSMQYFD